MGSLLRRMLVLASALIGLSLIGQSVQAEQAVVNQASDAASPSTAPADVFYPKYPATTPVAGVPQDLIQRGEYLAKMGDCIACHTNTHEGTAPFAGGLPLATPFGTFYSPNITPDKETGIGNWTEEDFIRALKEGRNPEGRNYFPVFPYIYYSKMTDDDAKALYAYFKSIPAVKQENKPLPFPFGLPGARFSLWGWNMLFFFPENNPITNQADKSPEWNRGKYIVDTLGHCSMCHTPLNPLGAPKSRYYLTGTFIDGWWAPNITKQGLESATVEQVANVFKHNQLINNAGPVQGPMAEVNHNSLNYLTDADRLAIATYLKTVESEDPLALEPSNEAPSLARGRQVYLTACILCHQDGAMSAPLIGDASNWYMRLKSSGLMGLYQHVIKGFNSMPVKGACVTCSDNDIISSVDYILNESLTRAQWNELKTGGTKKFPTKDENVDNKNGSVTE